MAKLKDGFYKLTAESIGSNDYVLLAGGGSKPLTDFALSAGNYVTLDTTQTITGKKLFNALIYILSGMSISDENGNGVLGVKSKTWTGIPADGTAISLGTLNNSLYFRSGGDDMYHYRTDKGTAYKVLDASNYTSYVNTTNFPGLNKTGTVTQVKIGSTAYNPSSGIVSLPAYPTSLPANGGNADTLDNIDSTGFLRNYSQNYAATISNATDISQTLTAGIALVHISNVEYSSVLTGYDFNNKAWQLRFRPSYNDGIYFRSQGTGTTWKKLAFISDIPTSLKNPNALTVFGVSYDGSAIKTVDMSTLIGVLGTGDSPITDSTHLLTSHISGFNSTGNTTTIYKRTANHLWSYIKGKTDGEYVTALSTNGNYVTWTKGGTTNNLTVPYATLAATVTCSASTSNTDRPIVLTNTSNGLYYTTKTTINYSTGNIKATSFQGKLLTANTAGIWVSGMTNAAIMYDNYTALNSSSYHPILGVKTNGENVVNFGAYVNSVGFYGYKKGRTENSYDWSFVFNSETGDVSTSKTITAGKFIGDLNNTLTFSAGAFSAKTYNNSTAVTVNIPTHTSHLTNNSGFLTSHQSLANYVTLNTALTITGLKTFESNSSTTGVSLILKNKGWAGNMSTAMDFYNGSAYTVPNARIETKMVGGGAAGGTLIFYTQSAHASTNPNPNGLVERLRIADGALVTISGLTVTNTLKISDTTATGHLIFSRGSYNYITAPSGGRISFCVNGNAAGSAANSELTIEDGAIVPGTTNVTSLGTNDLRWTSVYSQGEMVSGSKFRATNNNGSVSLYTSTNRGVYDETNGQWIVYMSLDGNHTYIPKWASKGSVTNPVYFNSNGEAVACTYSLNKTVPSDAKFTDTTYSAGTGISISSTTISNSGVRSVSINGNYLRVNTNGTNTDLTIPYALSSSRLLFNSTKNLQGLTCYYSGLTGSDDKTGAFVGPIAGTTTYSSILRLQSHVTDGGLYYRDLIFDVNSDRIWSRRVTNSGNPVLREIPMTRKVEFTPTPTNEGWYRFASFSTNSGRVSNCIFSILRSYYSPENEHYVFSVSIGHSGHISITLLSGYIGGHLISKIRVVYTNSSTCYLDFYMTSNNNESYKNAYAIEIYSGDGTIQTPTLTTTVGGTAYEFTTVNGCKSDRGFTGNLTGNASSASKLGSSTLGGTYQPIYLNSGSATAGTSYAKAIKAITRSGTTFTYTCIDGTTGTFTLLDSNSTYNVFGKTIDANYKTAYRTLTKGNANNGYYIAAIRNDTSSVDSSPIYGTGLAFGMADTHGYLYMNYSTALAWLGAGNADKLNWVKNLAFGDGTGASGTWGININGNAASATSLSSWTVAGSDATKRYIWMSHNDNSGKACYDAYLTYLTSTDTLFAKNVNFSGDQSLSGLTSTCNKANNANYMNSALQIREYNFGGAQDDTWGIAPRLSWHWSGRVQTQIGLNSSGDLKLSKDNFATSYLLLHAGNSSVTGGGSSAGSSITVNIGGTSTTLTIPSSLPANGGNADTVDNLHASDFFRAYGTLGTGNSYDSDWGQSVVTFDPVVNGTYPEGNPNVTILNLGNNYARRKQLAFNYNNNNIYFRRKIDNSWQTWVRLALASEIPTKVSQLTNDNGFVTGGPYLPLAGGTMTGCITTKTGNSTGIKVGDTYITSVSGELLLQNNSAIRFGGADWDWNVWAGLKYVPSSKTIYLGLADNNAFTANSAQSGGKIYFPGISNLYTGNGSNLIWHAGNDGSGSELDADLLDGLHLNSTTRNNEANKVMRTDGNGYANFGWINTTSGTASGTITRIYCSLDSYVRYLTPNATFIAMIGTLAEGTSNVTDNTEILTSYASNNGFADTNAPNVVYKRDALCVYNYIKGKLDSVYLAKGSYLTSRGYIGTTAVLASSAVLSLTGIGSISTAANNTYDLGATDTRWKTIYAYTIYAATAFYQSSDASLKTNIQKLSKDLLNRVYNINEVSFNWKESGKEAFGYIALDYEAISKTFVDRQDDGTLTLDYTKALVAQIAALKLKIVNLEERLHILERS